MEHALHGTATVACNHRTAGGHGLKRDDAEMLPLGRINHGVACCQQGRPLLIAEGLQQPHLRAQGTDEHTAVSRSGACQLSSRDEISHHELAHGCAWWLFSRLMPTNSTPARLHPLRSLQPHLFL